MVIRVKCGLKITIYFAVRTFYDANVLHQVDFLGILSLEHYVRKLALYHVTQHSPHHCTRSVLPLMILSDSSSCARLPQLERTFQNFQPWL